MKLLKKMLIAALILLLIFVGVKKYKPSMQAVYPQQCAFLIDEQFSAPFKMMLQSYVNQKYQSCKDVKKLLDEVSCRFNEIESMDAFVCKADHLCFTFDASKPLFILNEQVVCDNFCLAQKEHYQKDVVDGLFRITALSLPNIAKVTACVARVPSEIFEEFDVSWNRDDEILLSQKNKKSDALLFSATNLPTLDAIALFRQIQAACKTRKKQVYDFRFKDQIIVK